MWTVGIEVLLHLYLCVLELTAPSPLHGLSSWRDTDELNSLYPQPPPVSYRLGAYDLELLLSPTAEGEGGRHPVWTIRDISGDADGLGSRVVWSTDVDTAFVRLANASLNRSPILDGNYQLEEELMYMTDGMSIDNVDEVLNRVSIEGRLTSSGEGRRSVRHRDEKHKREGRHSGIAESPFLTATAVTLCTYRVDFFLDDSFSRAVRFQVSLQPAGALLSQLQPRTVLTFQCEDRRVFGFGESFSHFNLKGRRVPILVSEQGVGRGEQPITATLNRQTPGVGGDWYTTYAPKPIYLTDQNRSFLLLNSEVAFFDLTHSHRVEVEVWSHSVSGSLSQSPSMVEAVRAVTAVTGRQAPLPEWTQLGAIVGLEGGTANVSAIVESLYSAGVPLAGVWLQDWVGLQRSWDGDRLIWNWELNNDWYPQWDSMVASWRRRNTRVLTYISPFFSDPTAYSSSNTSFRHNFFREGIDNGFFIHRSDGSTYLMNSLSIQFAMLDLTNPRAVVWMKGIIANQTIAEAHSSGWMCDFGEYLPFDAVLFNGEAASSFHNRYPEEWAKLTRDAVEEAAVAEDVVFFMRSAWIRSPAYTPLFWLGDQLVSWDSNDGLRSVITGALSSGLTGHALTHSDIGGYTVETELGQSMDYVRSPELLKRWTEMAAFGFALFRTHIGSSTTSLDAQVYDSPDSMAHFGKFAKIFAHLSAMRRRLMRDASRKGLPMIRPLAMQFGYDAVVWDITEAYMVGEELLVAPCLYEGAAEVRVYLPASSGAWIHLWSGMQVDADQGTYVAVPAPIGFPPVFYRPSSTYGCSLYNFIADNNLSDTVPGRWQLRTSSLTRPSETSPQLLHPSAHSYLCSPYAIVLLLCVLFSAYRIALRVA